MTKPAALPTPGTLHKYGLTVETANEILKRQRGICPICERVPNGHWCIDHYHVKGWKNKPPEERVKYVRGLLCWFCNYYYLGKAITVRKAENVVSYLKRFEQTEKGLK